VAEIRIWHEERKTTDWTEYYLVLADGETSASFILAYNAKTKAVRVDPYSPPDINYTIHDGCDHENDECVLDDPESEESQDVYMAGKHSYAMQNLINLEKQVRQRKVAEQFQNG
jgi:hypothetical protein